MSRPDLLTLIQLSCLPYRTALFRGGGFKELTSLPNALRRYYTREEIAYARRYASENLKAIRAHPDIKVLWVGDQEYPTALGKIFDPPGVIYVRSLSESARDHSLGEIFSDSERCIAIVGTRKPSALSLVALRLYLRSLNLSDHATIDFEPPNIVSGFARGVDFEAHSESIRLGFPGIAVLGAGVLYPTPFSSHSLIKRSHQSNARLVLISEFPPLLQAQAHFFPRRNRIIAGLAGRTIVFQAPEKSGALITARSALEEGRDVICFDHPMLSDAENLGNRKLLFDGAELLIVPELDNKIIQKPRQVFPPTSAQLEFWRKKQSGLLWFRDDLFIESKKEDDGRAP